MIACYRWVLKLPEREHVLSLQKEGGFPKLLATLLVNRGLTDWRRAHTFLYPRLSDFEDPFRIPDMASAVRLIAETLLSGKKIGLYGDYDADGVTGTAILYLFLKELGARVEVLFPHRERDGYGFHAHLLPFFKEKEVALVITVDCGISAREAVEEAKRLGLRVIVTDHHELPPELPRAEAVITGKRTPKGSPFYDLAGVGMAFALIRALRSYLYEQGFFAGREVPNLKRYLDLVALGTVADMVPLVGENRLITVFGLDELSKSERPAIKALREVSGTNGAIGTQEVLFRLAPRINAAGRLREARLAFELLVSEEEEKARILARELNALNSERQRIEEKILNEALEMIKGEIPPGLVLYKEDWPLGVIGIVAGRLAERFYRPVVLLTRKKDQIKGSGRSIPEIDLFKAFQRCQETLLGFGGHPAAGGLKLAPEALPLFERQFGETVKVMLAEKTGKTTIEELKPQLFLEARAEIPELLDPDFLEGFQRLAPFGPGNPEPVVALSNFEIRNPRLVAEKHLRFTLWQKGTGVSAIFFQAPPDKLDFLRNLPQLGGFHLAAIPYISDFRGERYLELKVIDLQTTGR